jgi:4-alpha-glucanotransferase
VADFAECDAARQRVTSADFQEMLQRLREPRNVDYVGVAAAKFEILKLLYASFRANHLERGTQRCKEFRRFVAEQGEALRLHATYDALDGHLRLQGPQYWGWPSWPEDYRDPASPIVNRFARERVQDIEYFLYLQWLAAVQLRAAQANARELGMAIGLYGDVAVGANSAGSETWSNRHLYRQGASVGAPPDALALKGQDWGIPPQDPNELRAQQYQPFVGLIRNTMRNVGALRLDHVMSLYRLWWVPRGLLSKDGTYVHYPLADLIAIMALESERNACLVIGEDLGTVPEAMTVAMEHYRAYHYKVLLFEQEPNGRFKPPAAYVPTALAVVTTHDLPTLRGWWEEGDLVLRDRLDLYPSADFKTQAHATRASERRELLLALVAQNLWHWSPDQPLPAYSAALSRAVHAYLGLSHANIAMVQIEDLIGMADPVNVPGTDTEHANWQRKVIQETGDIFARVDVRDILAAMNTARRGVNPNV